MKEKISPHDPSHVAYDKYFEREEREVASAKKELPCGCILAIDYDKNLAIVYCPIHKSAPDLYEACRATDRYFKACVTAWAANGGKLVDNKGNAIAEADGLDTLCDTAGEMIVKALAKADSKE